MSNRAAMTENEKLEYITFLNAEEMLEEARWANEVTLDILTGEQLTVLFGSFHTARENADAGDFEYQWDPENGNILVIKRAPVFHEPICKCDHELTARCDEDGNGYTACNKCGSVWHDPDSIHYEEN